MEFACRRQRLMSGRLLTLLFRNRMAMIAFSFTSSFSPSGQVPS